MKSSSRVRVCVVSLSVSLVSLLGACAAEEPPALAEDAAATSSAGRISVITQNQYLGADLTPIITAPTPAAFNAAVKEALAQIASNKFQKRAYGLALQIAATQPHVVGLQEVFSFKLDGQHGAAPYRDHLADTLAALAQLGQHYVVAAQVQNLATTIPVDFNDDGVLDAGVDVLDRDIILVRAGLAATPVPYSSFCARPSLDGGPGCNYQIVATAPTVGGPLSVERGFVGVDVTVNGRAYRVVDTHLEVADLDPTNPLSPAIQAAQAQELVAILAASTPPGRTLLIVGDINSSPDDEVIDVGGFTIVPPYLQLVAAGHTDTWTVDPRVRPENTCCHAEDLRNPQPTLVERIDVIFSSAAPASAHADVLGDEPLERALLGLWPSDHGTVAARLRF